MRKISRFILLTTVVMLFSGCRSFRQAFDRLERGHHPEKKTEVRSPEPHSGGSEDSLFDAVFHRDEKRRQLPPDSAELTDQERTLVEKSMYGSSRMEEREFQRIRDKNRQERSRRRRKVYGGGNTLF